MFKSELPESGQKLVELMQSIQFGRIFYLGLSDGQIQFLPETERVDDFKLGGNKQPKIKNSSNDFELKQEVSEFFHDLNEIGNGFIEVIEVKRGLPDIFRIRNKVA
ncbi:MAG: hypothetical protein WC180_07045 [Candidatus Paceibacterota bacterium]